MRTILWAPDPHRTIMLADDIFGYSGSMENSASENGLLASITFQIINQTTTSTPVTLQVVALDGPQSIDLPAASNPPIIPVSSTFVSTISFLPLDFTQWSAIDFYHTGKIGVLVTSSTS